jgi:hypothetical protein
MCRTAPSFTTRLPAVSNPYGTPYGQNQPNPYSSGQGPYGAPAGGYQAPPKTDGVSIAALVLSFLCVLAPIGAILGFVGLSRTKGGQRKGRGLAIAAIVIGIVMTLLVIGLVVAVIALRGTPINDLKDGQCITGSGLDDKGGSVSTIKVVGCSEEHDGQVIATKTLSSKEADEYDFGNQEDIVTNCTPMLDKDEATLVFDPKYYLLALTQSENPSSGDHVACVLVLKDGGSLDRKLP